ncbi:GNAT family N-acetyltransferase [Desulfonatronospira sp.]|uniref:GNAT family N-acetyltransferase n=1 Tax=Desulfonatronospira sp. TaxID=1962951 RepID=UPI0025B93E8C|nr:GNAT family N-acetyltransferase [Desulfonatronospira sp.]
MNDILQDVCASSLVTAIENNLFRFLPLFDLCSQAEVHDDPQLLWSLTDIPFPLFNSIMRARLAPGDVNASIEAAITRGRAKNVPMLWWTGPTTRPSDLGLYLEKHGFTREDDAPGMALDLQTLNTDFPVPDGLTFEKVNDAESFKHWHHPFAMGFGMPDFAVNALIDLFKQISFGKQLPFLHYTGWLEEKPVAAGSVYLAAGVAGIYNVVTVPEARRKGIGTLITLALLREAQRAGYRISILHTSRMGLNVYRQLGFQDYCSIGQYLWSPAQA